MCTDNATPFGVLVWTWHISLLGLLLPCDAFLTASLSSLIVAGLACADMGPWGPEGHAKAGNTGATSSLYLGFHVGHC